METPLVEGVEQFKLTLGNYLKQNSTANGRSRLSKAASIIEMLKSL